jgi:hypothetical protein
MFVVVILLLLTGGIVIMHMLVLRFMESSQKTGKGGKNQYPMSVDAAPTQGQQF